MCAHKDKAGQEQSGRFLECSDDNTVTRVITESTRAGTLLDLILTDKEELVGVFKTGGSLGCSDHEMVEFRILRGGRRAKSRITTLGFRRADFSLFRDLLGRIP